MKWFFLFFGLSFPLLMFCQNSSLNDVEADFKKAHSTWATAGHEEEGRHKMASLIHICYQKANWDDNCLKIAYYHTFYLKVSGQYNQALDSFQSLINLDTGQIYTARIYNEISKVLYAKGDFYQAYTYAKKSFHSSNQSCPLVYKATHQIAQTCLLLHDSAQLKESIAWADSTIHYFSKCDNDNPYYIITEEINIGIAYKKLGQYDKALKIYSQSLSKLQSCCDRPGTLFDLYNNIANIYLSRGQYATSIKYYEKSIDIFNTGNIDYKSSSLAIIMRNICTSYIELKDYSTALNWISKSDVFINDFFGNRTSSTISFDHFENLVLQCNIYANRNNETNNKLDLDTALSYGHLAMLEFRKLKWQLTNDESKLVWAKELKDHQNLMIDLLIKADSIATAFLLAEESKYLILQDYFYSPSPSLIKDSMLLLYDSLYRLIQLTNKDYTSELFSLKKLRKQLDSLSNSGYSNNKWSNNNEFILSYYESEEKYYVFTFHNDSIRLINTIDKSSLIPLLDEAEVCINTQSEYYDIFNRLYKVLFKNISHQPNLTIIPSGRLLEFPFVALIDNEHDFLVKKSEITYRKSLFLGKPKKESQKNRPILIISPDLSTHLSLQKIRGAQSECKLIANQYECNYLSKDKANISEIESLSKSQYSILHIASHSSVDKNNPKNSFIFLSDSTNLRFDQITKLKLAADLVILSICESGSGKLMPSEGIIGLSYAFNISGNNNQILTQWNIEDKVSSNIIKAFYLGIQNGKAPAKALRSAQLNHLKNSPRMLQHPYYWAGYIHMGENDSVIINPKPDKKMYYILGCATLLLGLLFFIKRIK